MRLATEQAEQGTRRVHDARLLPVARRHDGMRWSAIGVYAFEARSMPGGWGRMTRDAHVVCNTNGWRNHIELFVGPPCVGLQLLA